MGNCLCFAGYNTYREACNVGTGRASSFEDFVDVMRPDDVRWVLKKEKIR